MKAICIVRKARDIRYLSSLKVVGTHLEGDRIPCVVNEGDVRAIGLLKSGGLPWTAIAPEPLDNTIRTHLWVRGAETVLELSGSAVIDSDEMELACRIATWIRSQGSEVQLVALGESEQDSGRRLLPALLAAELGWNIVRGVSAVTIHNDIASLIVDTDAQAKLEATLPLVLVAQESVDLGADPSDEFDLIEKFEKNPAQLISVSAQKLPLAQLRSLETPRARQTQPVRPLKAEEIAQVAEQLLAGRG